MSVYDQPITTYSDTTPHVRAIADIIKIIDPVDTPLIAALGGLDTARNKFDVKQNSYKIEILEDEYDPLTTTAAHGSTILTTDTVFTVADGSIFQDGHTIQIDDEYMVVKSVSTDNVTVMSRSYGGTNATHTGSVAIEIVGMARLEGDDATYGPIVDITAPYNYTSIFEKAIQVTGTQQVIDQYGIDDEFAYQSAKAVPHLLRLVEKMAFHGVRAAGSASAPRSAGGLLTYITDNNVAAGGGIAKTDIDNLAEYITLDGGSPDLLVMNPSIANDVRALIDSSSFVRVDQENTMFGMLPITRVSTQYGSLRLVESRWCPVSKAFMLDSRKVGYYALRPFFSEALAKTGDSVKGEVVGEFSLLVANDKAHGWISGLTS
jgi:hypothetical protein